jgi:ribosome-associated protein
MNRSPGRQPRVTEVPSHHKDSELAQAASSSTRSSNIEPKQLAAAVAWLAERKKGVDVKVYDVSEHIKVADYFVLVSGLSRPHVKSLYEEIHVHLKALGERHSKVEGTDLGWWVLLDYVDVVVHILQPEAREYYALDALYGECPEVDLSTVALPEMIDAPARMAE